MPRAASKATVDPIKERPPELLRKLIEVAMSLERRTMALYCRFETLFPAPDEVRIFWFDMAQHESRHFGALALVAGLLESAPQRTLRAAPTLKREHIVHLRDLLTRAEAEAKDAMPLVRAFELALEIESSEIEDLVLDLLAGLKGATERERAVQSMIHDLGDLSYMIEKYGSNSALLARADRVIEKQLSRLRRSPLQGVVQARKPRRGRAGGARKLAGKK